jgi:hypothetical protein
LSYFVKTLRMSSSAAYTIVGNFPEPGRRPDLLWIQTAGGQFLDCQVSLTDGGPYGTHYMADFSRSETVDDGTLEVFRPSFEELLVYLSKFVMCPGCETVLMSHDSTYCQSCYEVSCRVHVIPANCDPNCVICFEKPLIIGKMCVTCKHQVCVKCFCQYRTPTKCPHCRQTYPVRLKRKYVEEDDTESSDE